MRDSGKILRTLWNEHRDRRPLAKQAWELICSEAGRDRLLHTDLLRHHRTKSVTLREEIDLREGFDQLLEFFAMLEVALRCGAVFVPDDTEFFGQVLRCLRHRSFGRYYVEHYPLALPQLLAARLETFFESTRIREREVDHGLELDRFVSLVAAFRADPDVRALLWILDDGTWADGSNLATVLTTLSDAEATRDALVVEQPTSAQHAIRGVFEVSAFCDRLLPLLEQTRDSKLSAWFWHYQAYWFDILRKHEATLVRGVLRAVTRWEGDDKDCSTDVVGRNLRAVIDPAWGAPVAQMVERRARSLA